MKDPWGAGPWLSPRLAWQLWLAQEPKAWGTNDQKSEITPDHNLYEVVGNWLNLRRMTSQYMS